MTDEDEDEQKKMMEELNKSRKRFEQQMLQREVELSIEGDNNKQAEGSLLTDLIKTDLDELIKTSGDDIEFEFYYGGHLVNSNQTIYEILK